MNMIMIKKYSFVNGFTKVSSKTQSLSTRQFGLMKPHLISMAQLLVPQKFAHLWGQGSEFTRTHSLVWNVIQEFQWIILFFKEHFITPGTSTCIGHPLCLPLVKCMGMREFTFNITIEMLRAPSMSLP